MNREQQIVKIYNENPLKGIEAAAISGKMHYVQYKSKDITINVHTDGTVKNLEFPYWSTFDTLRYLEANHETMYGIVTLTVDQFKMLENAEAEEDQTDMYPNRAGVITGHLEDLAEYGKDYKIRLHGGARPIINIDEPELRLLLAYYNGELGVNSDGDVTVVLTPEQRDEIYRSEWAFHICEDIKAWLTSDECEIPEVMWPTERQIQYAAHRYAYDGKYDCTQDYWKNIEGVVKMSLEECEM